MIDLGVDVPPQKFVEAAQEKDGSIVALSALLTTTMTMMKTVVDAWRRPASGEDQGDDRRRPDHPAVCR